LVGTKVDGKLAGRNLRIFFTVKRFVHPKGIRKTKKNHAPLRAHAKGLKWVCAKAK